MDFTKVPQEEIVEKVIMRTKDRYPTFHKVLVEDRNKYMIKKLFGLSMNFPDKKILAVIGAGHKKEMEKMLKKKFEKVKSGKIDYVFSHTVDV
jgi:pheromone shutdown protein TraB